MGVDQLTPSGNVEGGDIDRVRATTELKAPLYSDNSSAIQEGRSIWYNDGSGAEAEGYYAYSSGGVVGPFSSGGSGSSQWQEDGSGSIVPIDGETVGDGTTDFDGASVSTESVATGLGQLDTKTVSVGTSSTDILTNNTFSASYFAIVGDLDEAGVERWTDVILAVAGGTVSVFSSVSRSGAPTRSYSINDENVALSLSDGPIDVDIQWWQF